MDGDRIPFVKDDEIRHASDTMLKSFDAMYDGNLSEAGYGAKLASEYFLSYVLALDPDKIAHEYGRMYDVAQRVGGTDKASGQIDLTRRHLAAWRGNAADAFVLQLTYMERFCQKEKDLILEGLRGVAAVLAVAVQVRENYRNLLAAANAAAINVREEQQAKETEAELTALVNLVEGIMTRDPKNLLASASETLVGMTKDLIPALIDDSGEDQVCTSFSREGRQLCQSLGDAYERVQLSFANLRNSALDPPELFEPLPAICDIASPDFSYEHFRNDFHDPGPIGPQVEEERKKYAEEKQARDSEIDRRLNHGDKGAV